MRQTERAAARVSRHALIKAAVAAGAALYAQPTLETLQAVDIAAAVSGPPPGGGSLPKYLLTTCGESGAVFASVGSSGKGHLRITMEGGCDKATMSVHLSDGDGDGAFQFHGTSVGYVVASPSITILATGTLQDSETSASCYLTVYNAATSCWPVPADEQIEMHCVVNDTVTYDRSKTALDPSGEPVALVLCP